MKQLLFAAILLSGLTATAQGASGCTSLYATTNILLSPHLGA